MQMRDARPSGPNGTLPGDRWNAQWAVAVGVLVLVLVIAAVMTTMGRHAGLRSVAGPVTPSDAAPATEAAPAPAPASVAPATQGALLTSPVVAAAALRSAGALDGVPAAALSAYQRAATVINGASSGCRLDWVVLAAVAAVDSDHGRGLPGGPVHTVAADGTVSPAIVGLPLDGQGGRGLVDDTDAGALDGDERFDAPVGPFGLLPSTWTTVAVDADDDGVRNPQDLDDAALATAVLLCNGGADLSQPLALRTSLGRLRAGTGYADAVLAVTGRYRTQSAAALAAAPVAVPVTYVDVPAAEQRQTVRPVLVASGARGPRPAAAVATPPVREPRPVRPNPPAPADGPETDPTGPTDPTDPTDPADPTPTDPTDPVDPANPTPTDPTDPGTCPVPEGPIDPNAPLDPDAPPSPTTTAATPAGTDGASDTPGAPDPAGEPGSDACTVPVPTASVRAARR
ncbi:hypothetical protein [Nocardioides sp.]|uniref:hypothetical protein n=1 Tax=Nocardioides sp. TaxID=35761 RepID=UPI003517F93F